MLLKPGQFDRAAEVGLRGIRDAREHGRYPDASIVNAAEALLACGRVAEAADLLDPLTDEPPDVDHYMLHGGRAELDLVRGNVEAAATRLQQVGSVVGRIFGIDNAREVAQRTAEVALWAGRPGDGLAQVRQALARYHVPDWTIQCGWLLAVGMRACADLAEQGRARRDESATQAALAAADDLETWVNRMGGKPFVDHPYVATIPAERAIWQAERSRLPGAVTQQRGRRRPTPGPRSAARTASPTRPGATPRPGCSPANRPPPSPARSETPQPRRIGTFRCWRRSTRWPIARAFHSTPRRRRPSRRRTARRTG